MRTNSACVAIAAVAVALSVDALAQPAARRAANVSALTAFPNFFHNQLVVLRGEFVQVGQSHRFRAAEGEESIQAVGKLGQPGSLQEIRAEFIDAGRLNKDDPRMQRDIAAAIEQQFGDRWPRPGEALFLNVLSSESAAPPTAPTIRAIALEPGRYQDRRVTVSGQFRGRNLYGDLPSSPGVSKWDFVVKVADAAIWVANLRPKARNIDLDVTARVDTGRWVEVSGVVRSAKGLTRIDGEAGSFAAATPIADETPTEPAPKNYGPPPEVIFSAPTEGESDVSLTTAVRLQFSRELDPATIKGRVRVSYNVQESIERGEQLPPAPPTDMTVQYVDANRTIEVRFARPLERFRTVKLELEPGITGRDGVAIKPFTLTFMLGGS